MTTFIPAGDDGTAVMVPPWLVMAEVMTMAAPVSAKVMTMVAVVMTMATAVMESED